MSKHAAIRSKRRQTLPVELPSSSKHDAGRRNPIRSTTLPTPLERVSTLKEADFKLRKDDKIILAMGASGSGKSSFINSVTGQKEAVAGHGLRSLTQEVRPFRCRSRSLSKIVLVDTPGFADTSRSDGDILESITTWLTDLNANGGEITGLLFFHRISDIRMSGHSLRNLHMFEKLCGEHAFGNVVLVTTMWDTVNPQVGLSRETELKQDFWKAMIKGGAQVSRVESKSSAASRQILDLVRHKPGVALAIQNEIVVQKKRVLDTAAGAMVADNLARLTADYQKTLAALDVDAQSSLTQNDPALRQRIAEERAQYQRLLDESIDAQNRLATADPVPGSSWRSNARRSFSWWRRLLRRLFGK